MNSQQVKKIVKDIEEDIKNGIDVSCKYTSFKEKYPKLFNMVTENGDYQDILNYMLQSLEKLEKGTSVTEIDKDLGFHLAKKYVYPRIDMKKEN